MKLIKILHRSKSRFLTKLPRHNIYLKSLATLTLLAFVSAAIWLGGPYVTWGNVLPFAPPEKRIYVILSLFLLWLLKLLMLDLDSVYAAPHYNEKIRKKLQELQSRFDGALQFLKNTSTSKRGDVVHLNQLPWYLLIGPQDAGKTELLAHSGVNFILQRRLAKQETSKNCDWWVTREACLIDVPGHYLVAQKTAEDKSTPPLILWRHFLRLIRKQRGKQGINGIIIALPLPEIMKQGDSKKYQTLLNDLTILIQEIRQTFTHTIPYQLVITKCDLLPGFSEFFAEAANEEIAQAWGITLPHQASLDKTHDLFSQQFNVLIKRLNQQLLWRLHQERNPMARPAIKDFPLQVERLKEFTLDFIKKLVSIHHSLSLQGIYLTSASQSEPEVTILDEAINTSQRAIQRFNQPLPSTRAYFIKQLLTQGLATARQQTPTINTLPAWKRRLAYALSVTTIGAIAVLLGRDFEQGIKQTYTLQNNLSDYRLVIQQAGDPDEHLLHTLNMLNTLQQSAKKTAFKLDLSSLLSFYSNKSQQKAGIVYQQALQAILLPEIKDYLGEYLTLPINKNAEFVYGALKAYLMLSDPKHFQADFVAVTVREILPKSMTAFEIEQLMHHLTLALKANNHALVLDTNLVSQTRKYFIALPNFQLSYIILKNMNGNNNAVDINLGTHVNTSPVFISRLALSNVPAMFTAKAFPTIVSQDTMLASEETLLGNWVLGEHLGTSKNTTLVPALAEQLRSAYVNNYIEVWENLLANIQLAAPKNLTQIDLTIINLISTDSPLLQLLQTLHDNTYFEPILSTSPNLHHLGALVDKRNQSDNLLYQVFASLQSLHIYIQTVLTADNEMKAAFEAVSGRMQNQTQNKPDPITQLRLVAEKSPEPIKNWLDKIANDTWHFLMQDAAHYLDTSWHKQVMQFYQADIANRYPFSANSTQEVDINKFVTFFGKPGIVLNFYTQFLQPFVDTSSHDWHWKIMDNKKPPFSDETLRQLQHAMRIHHTFFPNDDNKLYVQFALQPYQFSKQVKRVRMNINEKQFVDESPNEKNSAPPIPHLIAWPNKNDLRITSIQLITTTHAIQRHYPGTWGWFKLVNESFESALSKKEMVLNLSLNENSAKYLLFTNNKLNPFLSLNMRHFLLPQQLTDKKNA
jgi:type VI secretion system protein ImpL